MVKKVEAKTALKDAIEFQKMAESGERENLINRVVASAYIHALIRANDALCWYFLGDVPSNHSDAANYFRKLYEQHHIDEEYSRYTSNITQVLAQKNEVEYKGKDLSKSEFNKLKKQTNRFIQKVIKPILEKEEITT